jgi:hypothetical protein
MIICLGVGFFVFFGELSLLIANFNSQCSTKQRRHRIGSLLSTELIASVVICGALLMAIRTILVFTRDVADLRPKLSKIESALDRTRDRMADNKELVSTLSKEVAPIEDLEGKMRAHYEAIQEQEREAEKKNIENEEDELSGRKRRIQRKKMGFGESENEDLA